jgi:hypothetical protein
MALAGAHQGPETIDLKEKFKVEGAKQAVIFPHRLHQATLACGTCHQSPQGGDDLIVEFVNTSGVGNDFHKKFCWPCHEKMKVVKGKSCSTCHK